MENTEMNPTFTVDDFKKFMETEEGKKVLHPMFDSKVSQAINTWKANNTDKLVEEELIKRGYVQTEEQKEMLALKQEIESIKREKELAEKRTIALGELSSRGLDSSLADYVSYDSEESIRASVTTFKTIMDDLVSRELKKVTANSGAKPKADTKPQVNVPTKDIMKMTYHERRQLSQENPELYNQLMGIK